MVDVIVGLAAAAIGAWVVVISPPVVVGLPYAPYVVTADVLRHWPQEFCDGVRRVRGYPRRPSAQYRVSAPR
jgi:hypothetical protein